MEFNAFNNFCRKSFQHTRYLHSFHLLLASFILFCLKELTTANIIFTFAPDKGKILFDFNKQVSKKVRKFTTSYMVKDGLKSRHSDIISLLCQTPLILRKWAPSSNLKMTQWVHHHGEEILRTAPWNFTFICTSYGKKNKHMLSGETSDFFKLGISHLWEDDEMERCWKAQVMEGRWVHCIDLQETHNHLEINKLVCSLVWNGNL